MSNIEQQIEQFFSGQPYAVVGASNNPEKYGNKVLKCYLQNDKKVYPINPKESQIEGVDCFPALDKLPESVHGNSIITPPKVTEKVVEKAVELNIKNIWMQPGSESEQAVKLAKDNGINIIADGTCLLVVLKYHDIH